MAESTTSLEDSIGKMMTLLKSSSDLDCKNRDPVLQLSVSNLEKLKGII